MPQETAAFLFYVIQQVYISAKLFRYMRMAHIIMAYKDPEQIERLVKAMSHPHFDFYIHIDSKFDIGPFEYLNGLERVHLIKKRVKVSWAGYSFIDGLLNSIKEVFASGKKYDYINTLSGQDYPIKSSEEFYRFIEERKGNNFFTIEEFGSDWWKEAEKRISHYHFTDFEFKGRYVFQNIVNKIYSKRKFPFNYNLYGSNRCTWWTITSECAAYFVKFMEENAAVRRFAKFTWAPDEFLIPTIIMNSPLKNTVISDSYRYFDWSQGGSNPKILTVDDYDAIVNSNYFLARKFDINIDTEILDMIDANLLAVKGNLSSHQ